jgi:hypothetical protein
VPWASQVAHADHVVHGDHQHAAAFADPAVARVANYRAIAYCLDCTDRYHDASADPATTAHQFSDQAAHGATTPTHGYARTTPAYGGSHVHPGAHHATAGRLSG